MKFFTIISSVLIALACPVAAIADDFKYDDEPTVEVGGAEGGSPWEGEAPGVDVEVDDGVPTGVQKVETASVAVKINRAASTLTIVAPAAVTVPVYRIGASAMSMFSVNAGENVFVMPRGIYIIAGRKYML